MAFTPEITRSVVFPAEPKYPTRERAALLPHNTLGRTTGTPQIRRRAVREAEPEAVALVESGRSH